MFEIYYKGESWRYAFSDPDGCLSHEDREKLLWESIDLFKGSKNHKNIKGENFEGRIINTGKDGICGAFCGRRIQGKLETEFGKINCELLLSAGNPTVMN